MKLKFWEKDVEKVEKVHISKPTSPPPLTDKERVKCDRLNQDYRNKIKKAKLEAFKCLPSEIRDKTINSFKIRIFNDAYNNPDIVVSDEHSNLITKSKMNDNYNHKDLGTIGPHITIRQPAGIEVCTSDGYGHYYTNYIGLEELEAVHADKSIEEVLLGGERDTEFNKK